MIIDCHGHYTTVPKELRCPAARSPSSRSPERGSKAAISITDDQIRE